MPLDNTGVSLTQPDNINFLSPLGFRFTLKRLPTVNFFVVQASMPSVGMGAIAVPTPFKNFPVPGDKIEFGNFSLTFKVDEEMINYKEIYAWITGLTFPDNFSQFATLRRAAKTSDGSIVSDGTLTILNSAMKPNIDIRFEDMFPISISPLSFTTQDGDVNYIDATVDFKFNNFTIVSL